MGQPEDVAFLQVKDPSCTTQRFRSLVFTEQRSRPASLSEYRHREGRSFLGKGENRSLPKPFWDMRG